MTYAVRQARWAPLYDARLDTGAKDRKPALELVRRAEIKQTTGEDWSNVALAVSTVRTARGGSAPELNSLIVQYPSPPRPCAASVLHQRQARASDGSGARAMPAPAAMAESMAKRADEQEATVEVGGFQVTFRIPGRVSLGASEGAKSLRVSTATIAPDLAVRSVPVRDPTAFLEASFKQSEDAPLLPGRVAIYRDGVFVGRGQMARAAKDETVRLGFGADDKIKIERTVVKRNEGSAGLIVTTSKTDERASRPPYATAMTSRSGSRSRTSCRSARTKTSRSRCCRRPRRRPRPICATAAACWNGRSRPSPARSRTSSSPGACAGPRTRASS